MEVAWSFSVRGTCSRKRVGAVIARDGRVLVTGYNGAPKGMPHCEHPSEDDEGTGCRVAVHAEANAIAYAARWGIRIEGADLFSTCTPCLACAQLVVNAGIIRVVAAEPYRDPGGRELLISAGLEVVDWRAQVVILSKARYAEDDPLLK
jgi:dCMP deaminase